MSLLYVGVYAWKAFTSFVYVDHVTAGKLKCLRHRQYSSEKIILKGVPLGDRNFLLDNTRKMGREILRLYSNSVFNASIDCKYTSPRLFGRGIIASRITGRGVLCITARALYALQIVAIQINANRAFEELRVVWEGFVGLCYQGRILDVLIQPMLCECKDGLDAMICQNAMIILIEKHINIFLEYGKRHILNILFTVS